MIELLADAREGVQASQIARALELHRSSIYRYLTVLLENGYIAKTEEGRYRLGPRVFELASTALGRIELRNVAHPVLIRLCEETDATAHLCRLDGAEVIYLDKVESPRTLPLYSRVGGRAPAYCTGVGKTLLAYLQDEQLERILDETVFERHTTNTLTDREAVRRELAQIRRQGYGFDREEHEEGISCVAVPLFNFAEEVIGSISVTDLKRKIDGRESLYLERLLAAAQEISGVMGHQSKGERFE